MTPTGAVSSFAMMPTMPGMPAMPGMMPGMMPGIMPGMMPGMMPAMQTMAYHGAMAAMPAIQAAPAMPSTIRPNVETIRNTLRLYQVPDDDLLSHTI